MKNCTYQWHVFCLSALAFVLWSMFLYHMCLRDIDHCVYSVFIYRPLCLRVCLWYVWLTFICLSICLCIYNRKYRYYKLSTDAKNNWVLPMFGSLLVCLYFCPCFCLFKKKIMYVFSILALATPFNFELSDFDTLFLIWLSRKGSFYWTANDHCPKVKDIIWQDLRSLSF